MPGTLTILPQNPPPRNLFGRESVKNPRANMHRPRLPRLSRLARAAYLVKAADGGREAVIKPGVWAMLRGYGNDKAR